MFDNVFFGLSEEEACTAWEVSWVAGEPRHFVKFVENVPYTIGKYSAAYPNGAVS